MNSGISHHKLYFLNFIGERLYDSIAYIDIYVIDSEAKIVMLKTKHINRQMNRLKDWLNSSIESRLNF